jgi:hypothetical protein
LTDGPEDDIPAIRRFRRQWWPAKRGLDVERMAECFALPSRVWPSRSRRAR